MSEPQGGSSRTVVFADLAGYTALTDAHGDVSAADVAQRFFDLTASVLAGDARLVKTIGDAVMVVTSEPHHGLRVGLDLLRAVRAEPHFPGVRVGIAHGPVVERSSDVFGATVNIAARLTAHAGIGQVLVTHSIASLDTGNEGLTTVALGPTLLKNVAEAVEIYAIADEPHAATAQVLDPVCRMFVDAEDAPARLPWEDRIWLFCSFDCARKFALEPARYAAQYPSD